MFLLATVQLWRILPYHWRNSARSGEEWDNYGHSGCSQDEFANSAPTSSYLTSIHVSGYTAFRNHFIKLRVDATISTAEALRMPSPRPFARWGYILVFCLNGRLLTIRDYHKPSINTDKQAGSVSSLLLLFFFSRIGQMIKLCSCWPIRG